MKKLLILSLLLFVQPSFALCSIDENNTVCSLPNFREPMMQTYSPKSNVSEFSDSPEARLNPINRTTPNLQGRDFSPAEAEYTYNSNCQFGVCMQNRSTPLFQQPKQ